MYNASDRKDIRRAEKAARQAELDRINYLVGAMSIPQGRQWFYETMEACHIFNDPFTGDALQEAYMKGERNVGLRFFADIAQHCPDSYILMIREANDRRTILDIAESRAHNPDAAGERPGSEDNGRDAEGSEPSFDFDDHDGSTLQ